MIIDGDYEGDLIEDKRDANVNVARDNIIVAWSPNTSKAKWRSGIEGAAKTRL